MRHRIWVLLALTMALAVASACVSSRVSRLPVGTPVPTKTLRPTFTPTEPQPALQATATAPATSPADAGVAEATEQPEQATAEAAVATKAPSPTEATVEPEFTVNSQTVNIRSGPGTNFAIIGKLAQGERRPVTGMNNAGDWWEFDYDGRQGWVFGQNVSVAAAELVEVAENIPAAPTARPRPTARPQAAQPAPKPAQPAPAPQPAQPTKMFASSGGESRTADSPGSFQYLYFWGRLGKTGEATPDGYRLRVTTPWGTKEVPISTAWERAYPGYGSAEFVYNAKAEYPAPNASGEYRAVVIDGSGNEVSDAVTGQITDRTTDVILTWWRR